MNGSQIVVLVINGCIAYSAEILGAAAGLGAIAARDYGPGVRDLLQSTALAFGAISVIGLRRGVDRVHYAVKQVAGRGR